MLVHTGRCSGFEVLCKHALTCRQTGFLALLSDHAGDGGLRSAGGS